MRHKGYLIDLDGTMYRGNKAIEGAVDFVNALNRRQIPYLFVTNNSAMTQEAVSEKLNKMGIQSTPSHVFTTSMATAAHIKRIKGDNARCYVIGEEGLYHALLQQELTIVDGESDFVVMGIDRSINYEKLAKACLEIRSGAQFISTNSDISIPTEDGLVPGNGALTSVLTVSTGIEPTFIGKPESIIMKEALAVLGLPKNETLMVGDNYNTDINAGINAGVETLMVFTGVTSSDELSRLDKQPTYHVNTLKEWIDNI